VRPRFASLPRAGRAIAHPPKYHVRACASPFNAPWEEGLPGLPLMWNRPRQDTRSGALSAPFDARRYKVHAADGAPPDIYSDERFIRPPLPLHNTFTSEDLPLSSQVMIICMHDLKDAPPRTGEAGGRRPFVCSSSWAGPILCIFCSNRLCGVILAMKREASRQGK
jgi:hypothetical protein